jgi:hypothetical protein
MKSLLLILAIVTLWGCGPQQSSTERDQQQVQAEYLRIQGFYKPFVGTYVGSATINGNPFEVSLYLEASDEIDSSVGTIKEQPVPSLKGQFLECLQDPNQPCFNVDPLNPNNNIPIAITKAAYDPDNKNHMKIYSSGAAATGAGTSCPAGTVCTPYIYDVYSSPDFKTLTGQIYDGTKPVGPVTVTRVK